MRCSMKSIGSCKVIQVHLLQCSIIWPISPRKQTHRDNKAGACGVVRYRARGPPRQGCGPRIKVTAAEFTFVALDDAGRPRQIGRREEPVATADADDSHGDTLVERRQNSDPAAAR